MGNLLKVVVGAANIYDTIVGCEVFRFVLQKYLSILVFVVMRVFWGTFFGFVEELGRK